MSFQITAKHTNRWQSGNRRNPCQLCKWWRRRRGGTKGRMQEATPANMKWKLVDPIKGLRWKNRTCSIIKRWCPLQKLRSSGSWFYIPAPNKTYPAQSNCYRWSINRLFLRRDHRIMGNIRRCYTERLFECFTQTSFCFQDYLHGVQETT